MMGAPDLLGFVLRYDDGGERLSVTHDAGSKHWSKQVLIRQYESDDRIIYVDLADLDWLVGALNLVAIATGTRSAETNEDLAQSEGCQSGGEAASPNTSENPHD